MRLSCEVEYWIDKLSPVFSSLAAVIGIVIAIWVAKRQNRLLEQQLKQDLFDKRFAVYSAISSLAKTVDDRKGRIELRDLGTYLDASREAQFLFGADVMQYLREFTALVFALYESVQEHTTLDSLGQPQFNKTSETTGCVEAVANKRKSLEDVFRIYLDVKKV